MAAESRRAARLDPQDMPPPIRMEEGRRVLELHRYPPYLLATITATLSARASAMFRAELGVGVSDWRVIASLAQFPGSTASEIVEAVTLDKAAVSRALSGLSSRRLVDAIPGERDPRRKSWYLTDEGWSMHDALLDLALEQNAFLTRGVGTAELEACLDVLRRMQRNIMPPAEDSSASA